MIFDNVKRIAHERGTTVSAVEKALGFGHGTIRCWKKGSPTVGKLKAVAEYLGTTIDELLK